MAVTINRYTGDGSTTSFLVTFDQYSWTSIVVSLDNVTQDSGYTYNSTTKAIVFTTAPGEGVKVTLRRLSDVDLLFKFGQGAAFTGANIDSNFEQYQTAVEEVQNAADTAYVEDLIASEQEARIAADESIQSQISGATPALGSQISPVTWHAKTITNSIAVPADMNAFSVGDVTIAPGQDVTLGDNTEWYILGNLFERDDLYNVTANTLTTSDGTFTIDVDNIANLETQVSHTQAITVLAADKAPLASPSLTGVPTAPTAAAGTATTQIATTLFVSNALTSKADLASPTFTGTVTIPTLSNTTANITTANVTTLNVTNAVSLTGVTNASSAAAGKIGQMIESNASAIPLTNGVVGNITSISLPAGEWDVYGEIQLVSSATGVMTSFSGGISTTSATDAGFPYKTTIYANNNSTVAQYPTPRRLLQLSATTTVYLVASTVFGSGTVAAAGYLHARRIR